MPLLNHDQREHLKLLRESGSEGAIEICKLSLDYVNNGRNEKRFQTTSSKFNVTKDALQDSVNALVLLQINAIKTSISENEFAEATKSVFTPEQISIIWQFVTSKRDFMKNLLSQFGVHEFRFRDLAYRLEARISSRCLLTQAIPFISIRLYLDTEAINEYKSCLVSADEKDKSETAHVMQTPIARQKRQILFQTDPNNLINIIAILEKALDEAKTRRIRNIVKAF